MGMGEEMDSLLLFVFTVSEMVMVPPPEKLRVNSVNFKNILLWETPTFPGENLTFTVQYLRWVWGSLGWKVSEAKGTPPIHSNLVTTSDSSLHL